MTKARLSQCKRIIAYMKEHGVITTFLATRMNPPIMSLSRRMTDLERMGHVIDTETWAYNKRTKTKHKEYRLEREAKLLKCERAKECQDKRQRSGFEPCMHKKFHVRDIDCSGEPCVGWPTDKNGNGPRCVKVKQ